ncbi:MULTISPECIES: hypothetical protein [unclassified Streptomyces]|uniref:hypothetical protein n=1 Tax=unclassified Streptomyces TaxID=2593676 RepID=UPI003317EC9C
MTSDHPAPPATAEQALDIVRSRFAEPGLPDGSPAELRVEEFDAAGDRPDRLIAGPVTP